MKIAIKDLQGRPAGELEVKAELVTNSRGSQAVHDTVVAHMAGQRSGTHKVKTMGEVAGSGKKPWRQKGTGRARAGSFRSPLWRGGGVSHGPRPRDYSKKVNTKVRQLALRKALSARLNAGDVIVVDDLKMASAKTKDFQGVIQNLGIQGSSLFVVDVPDDNARLASRNIPSVGMTTGRELNTYDLLRFDKLVFTRAGFEQVEQRLGK